MTLLKKRLSKEITAAADDATYEPAKKANISAGGKSIKQPAVHPPRLVTPTSSSPKETVSLQEVNPSLMPLPPFERNGQPSSSAKASTTSTSTVNPLELLSSVVTSRLLEEKAVHLPPHANAVTSSTTKAKRRCSIHVPRPQARRTVEQQQKSPLLQASQTKPITAVQQGGQQSFSRHNYGTRTYANGSKFVGSFLNGKRHGYGTVQYPRGLGTYAGQWVNNKKCGVGSMHYANGDVYKGEWANDVPHGMGTLRLAPAAAIRVGCIGGEVYTGQFVRKQKEGEGKFIWANGDMFEGKWKGDVRHGEGVMTFGNNGSVVRQVYREGKLVSEWQSAYR